MGIVLGSNFDVQTGLPLDSRDQVADLTARDAISSLVRWEGMQVYVIAEAKTFKLVGGITNSDWQESGGGSGGGIQTVTTVTGNPTSIPEDAGCLYLMDSSSGHCAALLPMIGDVPDGWTVWFKRISSSNECVVVANADSSTIEGEPNRSLLYQWDAITVIKLNSTTWGVF